MLYPSSINTARKKVYTWASEQMQSDPRGNGTFTNRPAAVVVTIVQRMNDAMVNYEPDGPSWELHSWAVVRNSVEVVLVREVPV